MNKTRKTRTSNERINNIRELFSQGLKPLEIARQIGACTRTIKKFTKGMEKPKRQINFTMPDKKLSKRQQSVYLYRAGVRIDDIIKVTKNSYIYDMLKKDDIEERIRNGGKVSIDIMYEFGLMSYDDEPKAIKTVQYISLVDKAINDWKQRKVAK
jgi:hypothetical protein